jgi:endo-1,4-beta-mannosidase
MADSCRFGVNYVPSKDWLYGWVDWDARSIQRDLEAIASLGFDHVRVQCLWPYFQPNRTFVSPTMLARLGELTDIAAGCGLDVVVCVLNGWMSGTYFRPAWQGESRSVFGDSETLEAERALITAVAGALRTKGNVLGLDVGNEPNAMASFVGNDVSREQGDAWLTDMLAHCDLVMPGGFHTVGVDHVPWLRDDGPFSREVVGTTGAASIVHSWVYFTGALERYGVDGTGALHLARYLVEVARAYGTSRERPVWLQEIGVSSQWVPAADLPAFAASMLTHALAAQPWGITWWCSHDIDRSLAGFDELEYDLGLLTVDNEVKPAGAAIAAVIAAYRRGEGTGARTGTRIPLVVPAGQVPDLEFADRYFALVDAGEDPLIVREEDTVGAPVSSTAVREVVSD